MCVWLCVMSSIHYSPENTKKIPSTNTQRKLNFAACTCTTLKINDATVQPTTCYEGNMDLRKYIWNEIPRKRISVKKREEAEAEAQYSENSTVKPEEVAFEERRSLHWREETGYRLLWRSWSSWRLYEEEAGYECEKLMKMYPMKETWRENWRNIYLKRRGKENVKYERNEAQRNTWEGLNEEKPCENSLRKKEKERNYNECLSQLY